MKILSIIGRSLPAGFCLLFAALTASGQVRINDEDLENMMRNLNEDAQAFRSPFSSALKKSTIRKTNQAKDAENVATLFTKQTEALLNHFKRTKKGDTELSSVQSTGQQLGTVVRDHLPHSQAAVRWGKIETELQQVLSAYGMPPLPDQATENPRGITAGSTSSAGSCSQAVGTERAQRLVQECLQVSPATRPPCNAQNSCVLMIEEIKRGCALLGRSAPVFCGEYQ